MSLVDGLMIVKGSSLLLSSHSKFLQLHVPYTGDVHSVEETGAR